MISSQIQSQPHNKIYWSTLIFEAESSNEPFDNTTIVTAKSEFLSKAHELAMDYLYQLNNNNINENSIKQLTCSFIEDNKIQVFEFVSITDEGVFVCLNVDVIDDEAIWTALDKLYEIFDSMDHGYWVSDIPLTFSLSELNII